MSRPHHRETPARSANGHARTIAAGGLICRPTEAEPEVLLVHRPQYDDWTFPKGKSEPGELPELTALREVWEETGHHCTIVRELGTVEYVDHHSRLKTVHYWQMRAVRGAFAPNDEVDRAQWLPLSEAVRALSYSHDRELLLRSLSEIQRTVHSGPPERMALAL